KHLIEPLNGDYKSFDKHPIGTGAFRFDQQSDEGILLKANPNYFQGRPYLNQIEVKVFPTQRENLTHLISGQVDMLVLLDLKDLRNISNIPDIKIYSHLNPSLYSIFINQENKNLKSPILRKVLAQSLQLKEMLKGDQSYLTEQASGPVYSYESMVKENNNKDLSSQKLMELLESEGWHYFPKGNILKKNGEVFHVSILGIQGEELSEQILNDIQQQWLNFGMKISLQLLPTEEYVKKLYQGHRFDLSLVRYTDYPYTAASYGFWHSSQIGPGINFSSYKNAEADSALTRLRMSQKEEDRKKAYEDLKNIFYEDPPAIFLFWKKIPVAIHRRFQNIPEKYMGSFRDFRKVWVKPEEQKYKD
ncbi:MAG: ABC transporter substrate-binding protein, partial [Deltaproteobacteria bacterium]|nr:ABC transporter substrate-binding protein [Deltaproteobacteria bacterium]